MIRTATTYAQYGIDRCAVSGVRLRRLAAAGHPAVHRIARISLKYRTSGKSALRLSEVGFGTGDNAGVVVHGSSQEQLGIVQRALELGVNLFDTSAAYGRGAAEVNLGRMLQDLGARDALVMTKAFIPPSDVGRIAEKGTESLEDSLSRLRRSHVDVLLLHNPVRRNPDPAGDNPLITNPQVSTVLGGFSEVAQLEEAASASDAGPLSPADAAAVAAVHARGFS
jgi:aryl-alcohol dehydrogenase-like predicted oxidoreductase